MSSLCDPGWRIGKIDDGPSLLAFRHQGCGTVLPGIVLGARLDGNGIGEGGRAGG